MKISRRRFIAVYAAATSSWRRALGAAHGRNPSTGVAKLTGEGDRNMLWFREPAEQWLDALPAVDRKCLSMQGPFNQAYEPLGDLWIDHELGGEPTHYRRDLNLDTAIVRVSYSMEGGDLSARGFCFRARSAHRYTFHHGQARKSELHFATHDSTPW